MPHPPEPAAQRRALCRQLRQARLLATYTQDGASTALGWSIAKLLRIEAGTVGLSPTDLRALLDLYGVRGVQVRRRLEAMARLARREPWAAFRDVLSPQERSYLANEGAASQLRQYECVLIPELLRTEGYARTVINALALPGTAPQVLQRRLEACLARQAILDRDDPPQLRFVVDEAALLRLANCDRIIGSGQVERLHELADHPAVSLQILPLAVGLHGGLAGSFVLLDFPDPADASLLDRAGRTRPVLTATDQVAVYGRVFADLAAAASPPHMVHTILDQIMPRLPAEEMSR